jgi:hypothetical protein
MADVTRVSPAEHTETARALVGLFQEWQATHPRAPKSQFVKLAEQATRPQQQALLPAVCSVPARRSPATLGSDSDVWFADFWATYPRKVSKGQARKAWASAVRRTGDPAVILRGVHQFAADPNLPEAQFIPHPSTWLTGERWADGPLPARQVPQQGRTTRALVGLVQHTNNKRLPVLPAAGR